MLDITETSVHKLASLSPAKGSDMAKKVKTVKKNGRSTRVPWSKEDARKLKAHSKAKTPVTKIAKEMKRTPGAVRQQAFKAGISIGHRR